MIDNILLVAIKRRLAKEAAALYNGGRGTCSIDNCPHNAIALGMCNAHYLRTRNNKPLDTPIKRQSNGECMECGAAINGKGGWNRCQKHFKLARQKAIKEALVKALGGCCQQCGGVFPLAVYDFHHIGEKTAHPSELIVNESLEAIAKELSSCILLCANCHRIEHAR